MGYMRAEEILPLEMIELIQQYVDGESIYIPRKDCNRRKWGAGTRTRQELLARNHQIYCDFLSGMGISQLATRYFLSTKSIQRILREMKKG